MTRIGWRRDYQSLLLRRPEVLFEESEVSPAFPAFITRPYAYDKHDISKTIESGKISVGPPTRPSSSGPDP